MEKPRPRSMDITATPRRVTGGSRGMRLARRQLLTVIGIALFAVLLTLGSYWYRHRNDQAVLTDRYQIVYLLTGQVYFGKLQNTSGEYLTLTNVYMLQDQKDSAADTDNTSNILQVSRQVYGPDDSMAIRADQVQFWQNLRPDSKVAQAIDSTNK